MNAGSFFGREGARHTLALVVVVVVVVCFQLFLAPKAPQQPQIEKRSRFEAASRRWASREASKGSCARTRIPVRLCETDGGAGLTGRVPAWISSSTMRCAEWSPVKWATPQADRRSRCGGFDGGVRANRPGSLDRMTSVVGGPSALTPGRKPDGVVSSSTAWLTSFFRQSCPSNERWALHTHLPVGKGSAVGRVVESTSVTNLRRDVRGLQGRSPPRIGCCAFQKIQAKEPRWVGDSKGAGPAGRSVVLCCFRFEIFVSSDGSCRPDDDEVIR